MGHIQLSIPGVLLASGVFACSLQNFDYLTTGVADSGGAGASGATGDSGALVGTSGAQDDAAAEATGPAAVDAGATANDAVSMGEGSTVIVGPSSLVNPSFEQGYAGWTFTPPSAEGKYAYTQYPPTGGTTIDGQYELATWSQTDSFTVQVSQVLSNLPSGTYTFAGNFNCGTNNAAYLYARNCGGAEQRQNIALTAPTSWELVAITGIEVTAGTCEVGFYVDASPTDWLNADVFSFTMVADPTPGSDAGADAAVEE